MAGTVITPNRLREERLAAGIAAAEELARRADIPAAEYRHIEDGHLLPTPAQLARLTEALGGIAVSRLYVQNLRQLLAVEPYAGAEDFAAMFESKRGPERLLVARDEVTWLERRGTPDLRADVFLSMSCSTQESPHLLLDTVAAFSALGIRFVAAAGVGGCCGKPYVASDKAAAAESWMTSKVQRALAMGATAQVNWCTACQLTNTTAAARREIVDGVTHPIREVQLLTYLAERLEEMGDRVPWVGRLSRRVLVEGHQGMSTVHDLAQHENARLLRLIPGVEVVGLYEGYSAESPCGGRAREESMGPWTGPETAAQITARRGELAVMAEARGADTIACQHQGCHQLWSRYASDRLRVTHAISLLAEALGCAHPDRYQAAVRLGNPAQVVAQTRPVWESWAMKPEQALALATQLCDPRFTKGVTECACGGQGGGCREDLITIDVLTARTRPVR